MERCPASDYGLPNRLGQVSQEPPRVGRGLNRVDAHEDPPCRRVDGHDEVAAAGVFVHLVQVFVVDVLSVRIAGFEDVVRGHRFFFGLSARSLATPWSRIQRSRRLRVAHSISPGSSVGALTFSRASPLWILRELGATGDLPLGKRDGLALCGEARRLFVPPGHVVFDAGSRMPVQDGP